MTGVGGIDLRLPDSVLLLLVGRDGATDHLVERDGSRLFRGRRRRRRCGRCLDRSGGGRRSVGNRRLCCGMRRRMGRWLRRRLRLRFTRRRAVRSGGRRSHREILRGDDGGDRCLRSRSRWLRGGWQETRWLEARRLGGSHWLDGGDRRVRRRGCDGWCGGNGQGRRSRSRRRDGGGPHVCVRGDRRRHEKTEGRRGEPRDCNAKPRNRSRAAHGPDGREHLEVPIVELENAHLPGWPDARRGRPR
jgi:hypothetical protein